MGIIPARNQPTPARIRLFQFILIVLVGIIRIALIGSWCDRLLVALMRLFFKSALRQS